MCSAEKREITPRGGTIAGSPRPGKEGAGVKTPINPAGRPPDASARPDRFGRSLPASAFRLADSFPARRRARAGIGLPPGRQPHLIILKRPLNLYDPPGTWPDLIRTERISRRLLSLPRARGSPAGGCRPLPAPRPFACPPPPLLVNLFFRFGRAAPRAMTFTRNKGIDNSRDGPGVFSEKIQSGEGGFTRAPRGKPVLLLSGLPDSTRSLIINTGINSFLLLGIRHAAEEFNCRTVYGR